MINGVLRPLRHLCPLLLLLLLSACREQSEAAPQVLLTVAGRTVTLETFRASFAETLPVDQSLAPAEREELERAFLVQMVDRELTLAEAERLQVEVTDAELREAVAEARADYPEEEFLAQLAARGTAEGQWRQALQESLLMEKVIRQAVYARIAVTDDAIAEYYQEHRDEFDRPEQVRARQIVVAEEAEGLRLLEELRSGADFAELARRHSLSPDAEEGGDLGFFGRDEMPPEFDAVVFALPEGQLSELVKSDYGYHLFQVQERRPALRLPLEAVQETIRAALRSDLEEQAYLEWLRGLRERATITINWSLLD